MMTEIQRGLIRELSPLYAKNKAFKRSRGDRRDICLRRQLKLFQDRLIDSIKALKKKYYCKMTNKLIHAENSSKAIAQYQKGS